MSEIHVNLPAGDDYRIHVAPGALDRLGAIARDVAPAGRALLAIDENVLESHAPRARASLEAAGYALDEVVLRAEESQKSLETIHALYERMLAARLDRTSPAIALGGGIVGDTVGFAAATYLRGVPVIQAPTTLLAMVDASIGGKTGVNFPLPGGAGVGKNLIGSFWQPRAIVADPTTLATLPAREMRCGLAECLKHAMIADPDLARMIDERAEAIDARDEAVLADLVERAAAVKVGIVVEDVREAGRRALLNLGHTFAHVVEPLPEQDLRHGEAVAIGLVAAAHVARATGRFTDADRDAVIARVERAGLPTRLAKPADADALIEAMGYDKKVQGGRLRLVVPRAPVGADLVDDVPRDVVADAWRAVGTR